MYIYVWPNGDYCEEGELNSYLINGYGDDFTKIYLKEDVEDVEEFVAKLESTRKDVKENI